MIGNDPISVPPGVFLRLLGTSVDVEEEVVPAEEVTLALSVSISCFIIKQMMMPIRWLQPEVGGVPTIEFLYQVWSFSSNWILSVCLFSLVWYCPYVFVCLIFDFIN